MSFFSSLVRRAPQRPSTEGARAAVAVVRAGPVAGQLDAELADRGKPGVALPPSRQVIEERVAIDLCLAGQTDAFRPLVERYRPSVFALVYRLVGQSHEADDLVQQAFCNAFHALGDYNPSYRFSTWLFRIAINICKDYLKSKKRTECALPDEICSDAGLFSGFLPSADAQMEQKEAHLLVRRALEALPWKYRVVLVLKDIEERPYEEIRTLLRLPITTLKIRVVRARRMLRNFLEQAGHAPESASRGPGADAA